jgi:DNA repair exonuclease SbcCD ATPase subunit
MKEIYQSQIRFISIIAILIIAVMKISAQGTMPDVLNKNTLKDQLNYIEERTKIYEAYRAIREDMFQKIKGNVSDTLSAAKNKIEGLNKMTSKLNHTIDSLNTTLVSTKKRLEEITQTKNSISVLGLEINKLTYNKVMWTILAGLVCLLAIGFLVLKKNLLVTINIKKEIRELKDEFEAYRKTTREAREKMSMDHFNELKRLKGG